jgi:hypothetical protein
VPLHISGDMDVNPDDGEYRLSAQVGRVEDPIETSVEF